MPVLRATPQCQAEKWVESERTQAARAQKPTETKFVQKLHSEMRQGLCIGMLSAFRMLRISV